MGRIKTQYIKRVTKKLVKEHSDKVTTDFAKNKALVDEHADVKSKKDRNTIAGYATRLQKAKIKQSE